MGETYEELTAELSRERRAHIETRAGELIGEEKSSQRLKTQASGQVSTKVHCDGGLTVVGGGKSSAKSGVKAIRGDVSCYLSVTY